MAFLSSQWSTALVELPTLTFHHALLPLSIFSALHGIRVAMTYRQAIEQAAEHSLRDGTDPKPPRVPWIQALLSVLTMALGGGFTSSMSAKKRVSFWVTYVYLVFFLTGLLNSINRFAPLSLFSVALSPVGMLLGMPPSWLGSNVVVPTYALSFVLVQYTFVYDILRNMIPPAVLDSVLIIADSSLRAMSIAKLGVDGSRMRFAADSHQAGASEPWFAMLLLGMIAGSGGGMWADLLRLKSHHWSLATPSFTRAASYDMKAALLSAFFYAASTSPQFYGLLRKENTDGYEYGKGGLLELQDAKAMTILVMCTLMLGQRAEPSFFQLTGFSVGGVLQSLQAKMATATKSESSAIAEEQETVALKTIEQDDETAYQPLRRRGRRAVETVEVEEEIDEVEEEEPVKKPAARGRKKAAVKVESPVEAEVVVSDATPPRGSGRARKPRKEL